MGSFISSAVYDEILVKNLQTLSSNKIFLELRTTKKQRLKYCFSKNMSKLLVYAPGVVFLYEMDMILEIKNGVTETGGKDLAFNFRDLLPNNEYKFGPKLSAVFTVEEDIIFSLTVQESLEVWKFSKSNLYEKPQLIENFKLYGGSYNDINLSPSGNYIVVEPMRYYTNTKLTHDIYDLQKYRLQVQKPYGDLIRELKSAGDSNHYYKVRFIPHSMNDILCISSYSSQDSLFYSIVDQSEMVKNVNNLYVMSSTIDNNRKQVAYSYVDNSTGKGVIALSQLSDSESTTLNFLGKHKIVDMLCFNPDCSKIAYVTDTSVNVFSLQNKSLIFSKEISRIKTVARYIQIAITDLTFITHKKREVIALTLTVQAESSLIMIEI